MSANQFLFTSESVGAGHPDKVADQISDAILDHCLAADPMSRVAAETLCTTGLVVLAGEITTKADMSHATLDKIVRDKLCEIGYTDDSFGIDADTCEVQIRYDAQSADIAQGVDNAHDDAKEIGAGDQGIMFGFATNETDELMPLAIQLSHRLMQQQHHLRFNDARGQAVLRPDAKAQVTIKYVDGKAHSVDTVVLSTQHAADVSIEDVREYVVSEIILPVLDEHSENFTSDNPFEATRFLVNPTGRFVVGGPQGDCGLTGRKIIVDTYGGAAPHGGGAFSGKDSTKVDRSAAYAARWVAKHVVAAGLADKCLIQLSYAIGVAEPVSILVDTSGTNKGLDDNEIADLLKEHFSLTPAAIIEALELRQPIFQQTAAYGHFGREGFPWEIVDEAIVEALKDIAEATAELPEEGSID